MANRPWVTPEEVKDYSDRKSVKDRDDSKLVIDISRSEMYVISYTRNKFDDEVKYPVIPEPVKNAVVLLAETYAAGAAGLGGDAEVSGNFKSETFDDYSYNIIDSATKIDNLDLGFLLDDYIVENNGTVSMRLRKL